MGKLSDISKHFTEVTLDEIIKKAGGTRHVGYKFGKGFKKGDSYLSQVFRLCVFGVNDNNNSSPLEVNLIVKGMPDNLARRKVFRSADFFRNEINFYTKVVPAIEEFQRTRLVMPKNPFIEYPICYISYSDGENDFIALEDVTFTGYEAPNRQEYISLEDCLLTMRTLGRFHGIALAFNALEPQKFAATAKYLEETYYTEHLRVWYIDFLKLACEVAKDAIQKTYPNTKYEIVAEKFLKEDQLYNDLIHLVSTKNKFSVFGHGDCWTPNFLTKYNQNGTAAALKIIDFQLARCASPALDISFFIYSCTSEELRQQHYERLLREYHQSACDLIDDLGAESAKIIPWNEFQNELLQFARFGCGMGIESLPMSLIEEDEIADLDEMVENAVLTDVWNIQPFKEAKKCQRIADIIKHAIDQGYIK